jgi:hypothetical protein
MVQFLEEKASEISKRIVERVNSDDRFKALVGRDDELFERLERTCSHLGDWLSDPDDARMTRAYGPIARERSRQGVPVAEIVLLAQICKRTVVGLAREHAMADSGYAVLAEEELEHLVNSFFDALLYTMVREYEAETRAREATV